MQAVQSKALNLRSIRRLSRMACLDLSARRAAQNGGCREAHDLTRSPWRHHSIPFACWWPEQARSAGSISAGKRPDAKVVGGADADPLAGPRRNLAVLLEKPVVPSVSAPLPLLAAANTSKGFLMPGHVLRFSWDHDRMVEIVSSGRIGDPLYLNSRRY